MTILPYRFARLVALFAAMAALTLGARAQVIYVADTYNNRIGSYNLNGTAINAALISGVTSPYGVTVSGSTIYVAYANSKIGSYNLDGTAINAALISGLGQPNAVAVSGGTIYVADTYNYSIGSYNLDGTAINADLISGLSRSHAVEPLII